MDDEVRLLTNELRASIVSLTQSELRRQERLTQFDQHLMQMEASIREEVTRLRSTGSVVELVADEARRAVDGLARLGFDPTHEQLSELQQQVAAVEASLGEIREHVQTLRTPDLQPLQEGLDHLREQVAVSEALAEAGTAVSREAVDAQHLALARVTASADGLAASLGAVRSSIGTAAEAAGATTVAAIDARLDERLQATEARVNQALDAIVRQLDPQRVHERIDVLAALLSTVTEHLERVPEKTTATPHETAPARSTDD